MWVFLGMETIANIKYRSHVDSDSCLLAVCRWLIPHEVAPQQSFTMLQPANAKVIIKNGTTKNNHIYFILQFDPLKHSINNSSCNLTYTPEFIAVYGRRRVGKTFLIREAYGYKFSFDHTGILDAPLREQLSEFRESLYRAGMKNKALPKDKMMKALTTVFLIFSVPKPIQGRS